jgi:acyl dehydratase
VTQFFEDFRVGDRFALGSRTLTREEIIAFAREWDPQPFHTGEKDSAFGPGVIASGLQTICVLMRQFVDHVLHDTAVVAGRGAEHLRMYKPVVPGMELVCAAHVIALDASRDDRGVITFRGTIHTADGELVYEQSSETVVARRPAHLVFESPRDPVTLTVRVAGDEAVEDALWELPEEGGVLIRSIQPEDGGLSVELETHLPEDAAIAALRAHLPDLEVL